MVDKNPHLCYPYAKHVDRTADKDKDKKQLLDELSRMRGIIAGLEKSGIQLRQAEEALRESEERYRIAIEHSNDGVAIVKGDRHVYVNKRFLDMFGYKQPEEVVGMTRFLTVHPEDRERVAALNRERQRGEAVPGRYEFKGIRKDGSTLYVEVSATRIICQGEPATLAYLRDVSERKQHEEEQRQSQKMQALGTLAGGIAHDFNNILAAIIGFSERALNNIDEKSAARRYLELVRKSGLRGRDLIRQILTFSRKTTDNVQPLALAPIIEETCRMLRAMLPAAIRIETHIETESDEIEANASQIQQVLMNLSTNAAHAMRENGGTIGITLSETILDRGNPVLQPDMKTGPYVVLTVRDTGAGMDEEVRRRVFEPFFSTKSTGEGTGMGLSVVYGIVKSHKGAITVSSEPGIGSIFTIFFPRTGEDREHSKEAFDQPPRGKERILFVDDEEMLVEVTRTILEELGYQVSTATNCTDALKCFSQDPYGFDLVITDHFMDSMTGADLARELMRMRPDIPVILCTGWADAVSEEELKAIGIRELVIKPLTRQETARTIRRVLEDKRPAPGPRAAE